MISRLCYLSEHAGLDLRCRDVHKQTFGITWLKDMKVGFCANSGLNYTSKLNSFNGLISRCYYLSDLNCLLTAKSRKSVFLRRDSNYTWT